MDKATIANEYIDRNTDFETAARTLEAVNTIANYDAGLLDIVKQHSHNQNTTKERAQGERKMYYETV